MATFDITAAIQQAAAQGPNMNEVQKGGGSFEYQPPAEGVCLATLVGYIETGEVYDEKYSKTKNTVQLIFELASGKNAPRETDDGTKIPHRMTLNMTLSLNEKAHFYKLFRKLNYKGAAKHMAELLGDYWLVTIRHNKNKDGRVFANLDDIDRNYTFRPPVRIEGDELAGTAKQIPVPKPERISELRLFLWDFPSKAMWDSLFIDGTYEERKDDSGKVTHQARSKNVIQIRIKDATNWASSTMAEILSTGGELDLDPLSTSPEPEAKAEPEEALADSSDEDPLAGLV